MFLKPKWVNLLPQDLTPDKKRIQQLEKLRAEFGIPHEVFVAAVMGSPVTTRKVQRDCLELFRTQNPGVSEKELLRMVLISRIKAPPADFEMTEQEIDEAMKSINSFDELCDYIITLEEQEEPPLPDFLGLRKQIDEILLEEEIEKKAPAENIIKSLEQTYFNLRKEHPNRDEHWLLANTWLKRYGATEQAKQKGPKVMKFIAYKDTLNFSILGPPESIRGLALYLVYKELGDKYAVLYISEFSQIMEDIVKSKVNRAFLDKYKKRNPQTWKESQDVEDDSMQPNLYCLLKGVEFRQGHPEAADWLWNKSEIKKRMEGRFD